MTSVPPMKTPSSSSSESFGVNPYLLLLLFLNILVISMRRCALSMMHHRLHDANAHSINSVKLVVASDNPDRLLPLVKNHLTTHGPGYVQVAFYPL